MIFRAISSLMATRASFTLTITFPASGDDGDAAAYHKARFSRCFFTSGLPPIFLMVFGSPTVANDNGIIGSLRSPKILVIANQLEKKEG